MKFDNERQAAVERFFDHFRSYGMSQFQAAGLFSDDPSLLFTNATIVPLKGSAQQRDLPPPGVFVSQPCLRTHNLNLRPGEEPDYLSFFTMLGAFFTPDVPRREVMMSIIDYFTSAERVERERLVLRTRATPGYMVEEWSAIARSPQVQDGEASGYYEWSYGVPTWAGEGVTIALLQPDGTHLDIGNIVEITDDLGVVGTEFGFGVETYLARRDGVGHPYLRSLAYECAAGLPLNVVDTVVALSVMHVAGVRPSRSGRGGLQRRTYRELSERIDHYGISIPAVHDLALRFVRAQYPSVEADTIAHAITSELSKRADRADRFEQFVRLKRQDNDAPLALDQLVRLGRAKFDVGPRLALEIVRSRIGDLS